MHRTLAFLIGVAALSAQPAGTAPEGFDYWDSATLRAYSGQLSPNVNERMIASQSLGKYEGHNLVMIHREGDGEAEVHEHITDIFIVQSGAGTLVVGGTTVNPRTINPGEIRGSAIRDGVRRPLRPGDIAHIPANTPHQALVKPGKSLTYLIVKVYQ